MKTAAFSIKSFEREFLERANEEYDHELSFLKPQLDKKTARLAEGFPAVCAFANDVVNREVIEKLHAGGTRFLALRAAGFNNVDVEAACDRGMRIARVPEYSPYAVAEHCVGLMLALNRKIHRAHDRVREGNFSLDGLMGFDMHGKKVGIIGTGKIGLAAAKILAGFGCELTAFDPYKNDEAREIGVRYVELDELLKESDIVTLHCPLNPKTHHLIDTAEIKKMKDGVMLINTSRGALINTVAVIDGLKSGKIGYLGLDVYEEEGDLFFEDLSGKVIQDDVFARLLTFPNAIITSHQGFFTREAIENIAETTMKNLSDFEKGEVNPDNEVTRECIKKQPS